jgi:hypothetical protein
VWDPSSGLRRERDPTPCTMESARSRVLSLSPPFGRLGSPAGLDRLLESVWQELPKWDCTAEALSNTAKIETDVLIDIAIVALQTCEGSIHPPPAPFLGW